MVRQEADLTLFLNSTAFIEFVGMKVRIRERFAPKERDKTRPTVMVLSGNRNL